MSTLTAHIHVEWSELGGCVTRGSTACANFDYSGTASYVGSPGLGQADYRKDFSPGVTVTCGDGVHFPIGSRLDSYRVLLVCNGDGTFGVSLRWEGSREPTGGSFAVGGATLPGGPVNGTSYALSTIDSTINCGVVLASVAFTW